MIGFFLPGDSLLIVAGVLASAAFLEPGHPAQHLGAADRRSDLRDPRRPARPLARRALRPQALRQTELPLLQAGVRAQGRALLPEVRPAQGGRAGALHPDRAHLHEPGRRCAGHARQAVLRLEHHRRRPLGRRHPARRLPARRHARRTRSAGRSKIDKYIIPFVLVIVLISAIPIFIEIFRERRAKRRAKVSCNSRA